MLYISIYNKQRGSLIMIEGDLPKKAQEMVKEWMEENQAELLAMWESQQFHKLPPL